MLSCVFLAIYFGCSTGQRLRTYVAAAGAILQLYRNALITASHKYTRVIYADRGNEIR